LPVGSQSAKRRLGIRQATPEAVIVIDRLGDVHVIVLGFGLGAEHSEHRALRVV
jgi:hypothetical protein